jgi:hypothetical protein
LKKRLVVQSHCGGLDYLSPLGVLMALMPYTNYQKTTPTTFPQKQKTKQKKHSQPTGPMDARRLKVLAQKDVKVVRTKVRSMAPIALGKRLRVAQPRSDDPADTTESEEVQVDSEVPRRVAFSSHRSLFRDLLPCRRTDGI